MKNLSLILLVCLGFTLHAQSITAELSSDSILLGNTIKLNFHIQDSEAEFEAPDFTNLDIVSGPNYSSSVQIINGERSSEKNISFYVRPKELGQSFIPPAYLVDENYTLETQPLEFNVYPNPEGIITNPKVENDLMINLFDWPGMPFENPAPPKIKKSKSAQPTRKI